MTRAAGRPHHLPQLHAAAGEGRAERLGEGRLASGAGEAGHHLRRLQRVGPARPPRGQRRAHPGPAHPPARHRARLPHVVPAQQVRAGLRARARPRRGRAARAGVGAGARATSSWTPGTRRARSRRRSSGGCWPSSVDLRAFRARRDAGMCIEGGRTLPYPGDAAFRRSCSMGARVARSVFERLKERGEEVLNAALATRSMSQPALRAGHAGRHEGQGEARPGASAQALKQMNIPTRTEFKRALARIEAARAASWRGPKAAAEAARRSRAPRQAGPQRPPQEGGEAQGARAAPAVTGTASPSWARACCAGWPAKGGRTGWSRWTWPRRRPRWRVPHRAVDFTAPASDQQLLDVFREEEVETVVHPAFFTSPRRDTTHAHELESIGTLNLLAAAPRPACGTSSCARSRPCTARAARTRTSSPRSGRCSPAPAWRWLRDKLEAEQHAASFARRYPRAGRRPCCASRRCSGPACTPSTRGIFDHRVVPVLMGYDPLVQLLHPDDALDAALRRGPGAPGARRFNVVPTHAHPAGDRAAPRRQDPGAGAAPARLPGGRPAVGSRPRRRAGRLRGLRALPVRGRRREGAARAGLDRALLEPEALSAYLRYRHPRGEAAPAEATA